MRARLLLAVVCAACLACGGVRAQATLDITMINGPGNVFPCVDGSTPTNCTTCRKICAGVISCLSPSSTLTLGNAGSTVFALIEKGTTNTCAATSSFEVQILTPSPLASSPSVNATPGQFVIAQQSAPFRINEPLVTAINKDFSLLQGNLVARCDGFSMYFSPGGWCDCQADFKIDDFGGAPEFMGVTSGQAPFTGEQATTLASIYATRVKQNLSPVDFNECNNTFMGAHYEYDAKGRPFPVQCGRSFIVQETRVSFYNTSYCGTQYLLFNQGAFQNETSCRDGLGVVTNVSSNGAPQSEISSPAGVLFHRWYQNQSVAFPPINGVPDDPEWFFKLTPAVLPLNASTQLDMELTRLSNSVPQNRTQLTCIAEFVVLPYKDGDNNTFASPVLGFAPIASPNSARDVSFAAALLLLPALLLLLL